MPKGLKIRLPKIRITPKGVKVTKPSVKIGGKTSGVNISSKGVSATVGTRGATYNTRAGCLLSPFTFLASLFKKKAQP
jgi:hypothetical protein